MEETSARPATEVAKYLVQLYQREFGGKEKGKYRLGRRALLAISNRAAIRDAFIEDLADALVKEGYFLLDLRPTGASRDYAVIRMGYIENWRPLPKSIYEEFSVEKDAGEEVDDS